MADTTTIIKSWCAAAGMPEPSNGECHALAVALATQVAPAAVAVPDEHEAFEAWATQHAKTRGWLSLVREGESYAGCFSQTAWSAWQARAALSATPAEVQAEPVAIPNDLIESVDAWFAKNTGLGGCSDKDAAELAAIFTAPQAQPADALTQAALDVLAERRRQVEVEGWTPERDDQYVHGDMASAAGCYAMYTLAFLKGDPHHTWPWDKAWWKPSPDPRRNRVKACALLLAEIERLDRAAMAAAQEGGNAAKEA